MVKTSRPSWLAYNPASVLNVMWLLCWSEDLERGERSGSSGTSWDHVTTFDLATLPCLEQAVSSYQNENEI